ncbi:PREDICTED: ervatamin-C [Bactrocera latifrons]|uniref:Cathepsin L-like proteinase n=1 Tax=Bactrocera latifrons TaxID=174628 RepID=A0A0K8W7C2_BACLA|nr:PREDICTED: ervatamin-C [Bactrocera latifrons]
MCGAKEFFAVLLLTTIFSFEFGDTVIVPALTINSAEWRSYVSTYGKTYTNIPESYAVFYYNYNNRLITAHNLQADRNPNTVTYRLGVNQFTDMRFIHFKALFPKTTLPTTAPSATAPPTVQTAAASFDIITELQLTITVEDQGTVCNSGWAYATAKAIEIYAASLMVSTERLSAQNLIDCAGSGIGCTRQVAQIAFEYLVGFSQPLYSVTDYPDNNKLATQGMCVPPTTATGTPVTLASYSRIDNPDDDTIMQYVSALFPVVIEYDPTSFDFMEYKSGIFQQPRTKGGSHYMVVVGYGTDTTTNLNYWLVLNSFGTTWGEDGYIRIIRQSNKPLTTVAFFPTAFGP